MPAHTASGTSEILTDRDYRKIAQHLRGVVWKSRSRASRWSGTWVWQVQNESGQPVAGGQEGHFHLAVRAATEATVAMRMYWFWGLKTPKRLRRLAGEGF